MKKVGLYLRVSTEEQSKHGLSLETQLKKLQDYCEFKNWEIFKIYKDEGISGGSIKKRKAFKQMLQESKEGKFSAIIVTKIDRAFRNVVDALLTLEELRVSGIDFVSVGEDIDTTTPMGKAMFTIVSVFAQLEREINVGRVKDVRQYRFDQGMFPARPPFGYEKIIKNKKVIGFRQNKKEAEIVCDIFLMTSEGKGYNEICSKYKGKIPRIKKGKKIMGNLDPQSYYNILKNRAYCGYVVFEGQEKEGIHEPIISEELWRKVNGSS